jgi:hypothetical protein
MSLSSAVLIDDFESYALGDVKTVARPPWFEVNTGTGYADIGAYNDNKFLIFGWANSDGYNRGAYIPVPPVDNDSTATLFVRIFASKASINHSFGLSDSTPGTNFDSYEAQLIGVDEGGTSEPFALKVRNGGAIETCTHLNRETWYNVWMVVDQTTDTFDVYVTTGKANATESDRVVADAAFRNGTTSDLAYFFALSSAKGPNFRIDDIYLMDGVFLYNPTIDVLAAHYPVPGDGAKGVTDSMLTWNTGRDPNNLEQANTNITHHYLYFRDTDPNVLLPDTQKVLIAANDLTGSYEVGEILPDKTYYWRVDEVLNYGSPTDPGSIIEGTLWQFESWRSAPVVTGDPVNTMIDAEDDAVFTVAFTSFSTADVMWLKYVDGINDLPLTDAGKYTVDTDGTTYTTLTVKDADVTDEGYYYILLSSDGGSDTSAQAALAVRQLKAHWTLDGLTGGQYADETGSYPADPNGTPVFVDGADPAITGQGVVVDADNGFAAAGNWNPSELSNQLTISMWAKWAGHYSPANYQGLIAKRNAWGPDNMMWQIEIDPNSGRLSYKNGSNNSVNTDPLPVEQWVHIAVTYDGTTATLYRNGLSVAAATVPFSNKTDANIVIGGVQLSDNEVFESVFNGVLDDVRIYNHALDKYGVADLYYEVTKKGLCLDMDSNAAAFDFDGNCRVDMIDFAVFAAEWLKCGRYPSESCSD